MEACYSKRNHPGGDLSSFNSRRFPESKCYETEALKWPDEMEVRGFQGYNHVRCPYSRRGCDNCGFHSCHIDSMILAVDGACPGNGKDASVSGFGVYFGNPKHKNWAFRIYDSDGLHTNQRAELWGAWGALRAGLVFAKQGGQWDCSKCERPCRLKHLVIKSDSAYVVNSFCDYISKWERNGWKTANNKPVKNQDLWHAILRIVNRLESRDVAVQFWHVPRECNREADALANEALNSAEVFSNEDVKDLEFAVKLNWMEARMRFLTVDPT
eukprot:Protomagalhaensia_wolfi_Nauph_80__3678@NODE_370_length_2662_cov_769_619520_g279_i0_p2_GENE_NODE_370_length_2662_cov_769_619520_g279_i0NODE_370_length_2662_cov_769_619520_g279_i0_p2_ORF_typecomplete_len270_score26_57RNase_H/PF00075_24/5_2e31RVT_3/PF13456_6/1_9e14_NODE_370_length_2662_cov_769_619520_g279_i017712580